MTARVRDRRGSRTALRAGRGRLDRRQILGVLAGATVVWLLVGGWTGVAAAVLVAAGLWRPLGRMETAAQRRERTATVADLPFSADLLAAALRSGAPTEHGIRVVGGALGGTVGGALVRVADGLRMGLEPVDAWAALGPTPAARRLADAVVRSADSGAALARSLARLADDLRSSRVVLMEVAAQRIGVLMVLPLGLCFLPAFVLAGIVPVIVAVLGGVLR
ncbi:MAG TPA: type II secretion system F family protein [Micromonosporaceae bacterium]|nr:type II secretion system F family protein [Micromonosporaceae bacterium]